MQIYKGNEANHEAIEPGEAKASLCKLATAGRTFAYHEDGNSGKWAKMVEGKNKVPLSARRKLPS